MKNALTIAGAIMVCAGGIYGIATLDFRGGGIFMIIGVLSFLLSEKIKGKY